MTLLWHCLWVGAGGFAGAIARFLLSTWIIGRAGAAFPWHTLTINVTGSFLIGMLLALFSESIDLDPVWRLLLVVGFLGGYTTFSTYSFDVLALLRHGAWWPAAGYIAASNVLSIAACFADIAIARLLPGATT